MNSFKETWLNTSKSVDKVNNLSNIAIKNNLAGQTIPNLTFTNTQPITVPNNSSVFNVTQQESKNLNIDFIQPNSGYRNHSSITMRVKNGNGANFTDILKITAKNTNEGASLIVENNKLNFDNPTTISGVARPTENNQAANKEYVDSKFGYVEGSATVNNGATHDILQLSGKKPISFMVYRKRASDSYWFLENTANLGYQLFERDNKLVIWNNSSATNQFTNEFKWLITYINL